MAILKKQFEIRTGERVVSRNEDSTLSPFIVRNEVAISWK